MGTEFPRIPVVNRTATSMQAVTRAVDTQQMRRVLITRRKDAARLARLERKHPAQYQALASLIFREGKIYVRKDVVLQLFGFEDTSWKQFFRNSDEELLIPSKDLIPSSINMEQIDYFTNIVKQKILQARLGLESDESEEIDNKKQRLTHHLLRYIHEVADSSSDFITRSEITKIRVPKSILSRIERGRLDITTVTDSDLRAASRPRLIKKGKVLDLGRLQLAPRSFFGVIRDVAKSIWVLHFSKKQRDEYDFAFFVHPRELKDVLRAFPFLKPISKMPWLMNAVMKVIPPFILSDITGLTDVKGKPMKGLLFAVVLTRGMFEADNHGSRVRVAKGINLAKKLGAKIIGLGALLPYFSRYGTCDELEVVKQDVTLTTGHPYTVITMCRNVKDIIKIHPQRDPLVAVVGAAGSTGSCTALKLAKDGVKRVMLVDKQMETPVVNLNSLKDEMLRLNPSMEVKIKVDEIAAVKQAHIVVVVTSAEGTIVKSEHLAPGTIVIDDTQPRNVNPQLALERPDIKVLTVIAPLQHATPNFVFDRHVPFTDGVFTCLADAAVRAILRLDVPAVGVADLEKVEFAERMIEQLKDVFGSAIPDFEFYTYNRRKVSVAELLEVADLTCQPHS